MKVLKHRPASNLTMPDITICPFILLNNVYAEHPGIEHKNRRSALISLAIRVSKK